MAYQHRGSPLHWLLSTSVLERGTMRMLMTFLHCLQTKEREGKIGSRQTYTHAPTTTISSGGEALCVGRFLPHHLRLRGCCLVILQSHFVRWTKPLSPSLLLGSL